MTSLVGRGNCNNPFYEIQGPVFRYVVENGVRIDSSYLPLRQRICGCDDDGRSFFETHAYVKSGDLIFDACVGPVLGTMTHDQYLSTLIDHSTTNECVNGYFSPWSQGAHTRRSNYFQLVNEER